VFVPFFGNTAYTGTLVPKLAQKTGAAIVMCAVERIPEAQGFRLRLMPGPELASEKDAEKGAAQLNAALEQLILCAPEQFTWNYKRFRRVPVGQKKNPYRDL
jgi:KDO2-lipid IV(A) lauroyltransferase